MTTAVKHLRRSFTDRRQVRLRFGVSVLIISKWRKGKGAGKSAVRKRAARKAPARTARTAQPASSTAGGDGEGDALEQMLVVREKIQELQEEFDSLKAGL